MPLSVSYLETEMIGSNHGRVAGWWAKVGLDTTTVDGTNQSFQGPLASAMRMLNYTLADPIAVTNSDLSAIAPDQIDKLMDVTEWRCLQKIAQNYGKVSQQISMGRQDLSDFADRVQTRLTEWSAYLRNTYQIGLGTLTPGSINLDIDRNDDPTLPENTILF